MKTEVISKKKRIYALITALIMLLNMFSPYGILIHEVQAAIANGEPYYELKLLKPGDPNASDVDDATYYYYYDYMNFKANTPDEAQTRGVVVQLSLKGNDKINAGSISLKYDSSKITPSYEKETRSGRLTIKEFVEAETYSDFATNNWAGGKAPVWDESSNQITIAGSVDGDYYIEDGKIIATFIFKLKEGISIDNLDTSTFQVVSHEYVRQGLRIPYYIIENGEKTQKYVDGQDYLVYEGFAQGAKKISGITISTKPTKNKYYLGETLDLSDGKITVSYNDGTSDEPITIADAIASGKLTTNTTVALNTKTVTLTYEGKTVDFDYYVLDSIASGNDLTKMDYEHDDVIEFTGGTILATYKNSSNEMQTASLNIANEITAGNISVDKTKANIDNKKVTYTYHGKTCEMTLNVTDPIDKIAVTTPPTKTEWNDGETIDYSGGKITAYTKSNKIHSVVNITDSSVTKSATVASIALIPEAERWTKSDGTKAGKQKITLTYEGKTVIYDPTINDTITSITITKQPTAKNKYGTLVENVSFGGIEATATTAGGATINLSESVLTIDKTGYNPNTINAQEFTVKYGNITATNKATIQLINYIKKITVNFTQTEFDYDTPIENIVSNGTYKEVYANNTESEAKPLTKSMVTGGYVQKPAGSLFTNGEYEQTLQIQLTTSSNEFDILPATTTQSITTKDIVEKVEMEYQPTKKTYNYGENFENGTGTIKITYKSGKTSNVSISNSKVSLTETDGSTINMRPPKGEFTNEVATKTIKVTYTDNGKTYNTSFDIKIKDIVSNITITTDPKKQFNYSETFVTTGGKLTVTYESGNIEQKDLNENWVTEEDDSEVNMSPDKSVYQTTDTISKTLKVTYGTETTTYSITIKNNVSSIAMKTNPTDTNYNLNDTAYKLQNTAGTNGYADITVTYQAGNTKVVSLNDSGIELYPVAPDTIAGGTKTVTVKYGTKQDGTKAETSFNITVKDSVKSITIDPEHTIPQNQKYGEDINLNGAKIIVTKGSGATPVTITKDMVTYDKNTLGNQQITITYREDVNGDPVTTTANVKVQDYVKSITLNKNTITAKYGEELSKIISDNNITYTVKYAAQGEQPAQSLTTEMVASYNKNTTNAQNLTVTYIDTVKDLYENCNIATATLNITLQNTVKSIAITAPTKTEYNHGDTLDDPTIVVTYEDDTTKTVENAHNYIFETDGTTPAKMAPIDASGENYDSTNYKWTKNFVIKYSEGEGANKVEETVNYNNVTINNQVQSIEMFSSPTKQEYNINDTTWNLTGAQITVTRKAGPAYQINIEESMVPALSTLTTAEQENKTVTVTYEGKTTSFIINVVNGVKTIVITAPTNDEGTKFEHGSTLTFGNGTIVVTKADGTVKNVPITRSFVKETSNGNEVNMSPTYEGEYKTNKKITKNLTIEYSEGGVSAQAKEYSITITNPIDTIQIKEYPQNEFKVNETVNNKGAKGKIEITRKSGDKDEIAITGTMIENDIDTSVEISNVKNYVVYQDPIEEIERRLEYTYNVTNGIQSVSIKVPDAQSDLVFNYGDTITYNSGAINKVSLSNVLSSNPGFNYDGVTIVDKETNLTPRTDKFTSDTDFDENNEAKMTIKVTYVEPTDSTKTATAEYEITIKNNVDTVRVDPLPTDTTYNVNDTAYKLEGGKLKIQRAVGPEKEVDLKDITFTPGGNTITDLTTLTTTANAGKAQTVTITYEGKPATFNINIVNGITGITITKPSKTEYEHGENLSLEGNVVLHYADGTDNSANPIPLTLSMFTENGGTVNMSPDAGTYDQTTFKQSKTVQITYTDENGNSYDPIDYTFTLENVIDHLEYVTAPTGTYELGETINWPIGTIKTVRKAKDESDPINITQDMVTNLSTETATTEGKTAKITYAGKNLDYIYEVHDFVETVVITVPTNDEGLKFFHGDTLTFGNGSITVNYKSSAGTPTSITGSMAGLTIKEVVNGTEQNVDMHNNTYGSDNKATKTIRLTYEKDGKTDTKDYTITITNDVTKIEIVEPTDKTYNIGDTNYKAGIQVKVYRSSSNSTPAETITLPNNNFEITDLSTLTATAGTGKPVTVTYKGTDKKPGATITNTFTINVEDNAIASQEIVGAETNYKVGDNFNYNKGELVVTRKNGNVERYPLNTAEMSITGFNSSAEVTGQEITVSYTKDGETYTATYNVNITNAITSISLTGPSKKEYYYEEELDLSGAELEITDINGNVLPTKVPVTTNMVSGYNKAPGTSVTYPQTQQVTVTYGKKADGSDATATFEITLKDHITKIEVEGAKTQYEYSETGELDLTQGHIKVTMASGTPVTPVNLNDSEVTVDTLNKFSPTTKGTQTITVQYGVDKENNPLTTTYDVTVEPKFLGVEIKTPTKTKYYHTDTLDLSTGSIIVKWAGKENETLSIEPSMVVDEAGNAVDLSKTTYDDTNKTQKTLKIKYDYTAPDGTAKTKEENYPIEIINKVSSITIVEQPKEDYNYNDSIDDTKGTFEVIWQNGSKKTIPLADPRITIENFNTSSQGTKNVNVKFTENEESANTSYSIEVTDNVSKIEIVGTPKQDYNCLDSLDLSGLQLEVTRPSGTETISINDAIITGFDTNSPGEQTITVSYGGKTDTFKVNVKDWLKDIEFTKPTKKNYKKTDTQIDLAGALITEVYASGKKVQNIQVTQNMLSTFDNTKLGEQTIEVNYKTFTRTFKVIVSDGLAGINVTKFPVDEYLYGESLNLAGATIEVVTESGETKEVPITKEMVTGYETKPASNKFNKAGEYIQTITITYSEEGVTKKVNYPITTKDYFSKIKVQGLEKNYNYGENIKVANATVSKVSASGVVSDTTALTIDMISGYDSKKLGKQTITITYQGKHTTEEINVKDNILGISINSNPSKTTYNYNTSLDLSGAKLNVIKNSGTSVINITKDMVSGYNARKDGAQTITVTYAGLKATFTVVVNAKPYVAPVQKPTTPVVEEPVIQEPVVEEPVIEKPVQKPIERPIERPVEKPEVKEENKINPLLITSGSIGSLAILLLLLLLLTKKNVEIYVEEEKDIRLIGKEKLNKNDAQKLDLTKYTNKYPNEVLQVVFSKKLSKKLDEKTVRIITGENNEKPVIIKYEEEEFITEINNKKRTTKEKIEK